MAGVAYFHRAFVGQQRRGHRATRLAFAEGWSDLFLDLDPNRGIAAGERWERALNEAATIARFPRSQKFLLGDRIQSTALDLLEALIEATYTRDRRAHLARANLVADLMHQ